MLYVKVVTPLVLKCWVWPMITYSHLGPKSIYSYMDDLVIANCLIDARVFVHAFATYFISYLIVWACWLHNFLHSRTPIFCFDCLAFSFCQMDGQECLSTPSSIYSFLLSNSIHATPQSLIESYSNPLSEEHSEPPIRHRLKLPKPLSAFWSDRFIPFGHNEFIKLI